jgi:predicted  nucleic acid-binding Zn-ribbon protein
MNNAQENKLRETLANLRREKEFLQQQKQEIQNNIIKINLRIDDINAEILNLKEGLE